MSIYNGYSPEYTSDAYTAPVVTRVPVGEGEAVEYVHELKAMLGMNAGTTDYDSTLLRLLQTAISTVEVYTGLSLQPATVTVQFARYGGESLPFGPVQSEPPVSIAHQVTGASVTFTNTTTDAVSAGQYPTITGNFRAGSAEYKAGYSRDSATGPIIPDALIGAILEHAASAFRVSGVTEGRPSTYWKTLAGPFRRF